MIKKLTAIVFVIVGSIFFADFASAQSSPGLVYGQVPTATQWNSYFAAKQDVIGYTPLNKAGDTMLGELITNSPNASISGFNLPHGTSPASPVNGDLWTTSSGLFVRINGSTIGPLGTAACPTCAVINATNNFTAAQNINLTGGSLAAAQTGTVLQSANASGVETRIELDSYGAVARFSSVAYGGTFLSPAALSSGAEIGEYNVLGYDGSTVVGPRGAFRCFASQTWVHNSANGTYCDIAVTANGTTAEAESIRFENDGGITLPSTVTGGDKGAGTINAAGLFVNGSTVVTNLTGPITSVGNATSVAAQTGTGSTFVMQNSPSLTTPNIGAATGSSLSVTGQLTSTVSTGTAPLVVSSTTQVENLNAATAGTATTATNANNVATTQVSTNASFFPLFVASSTNGNQAVDLGTALTFNPSTGALSSTSFSGAGTGLTGTAASLTAGNVTTNANLTGPVTSIGNATSIASSINLPGSPTTTTQSALDNSTKIATTAYTDSAVAAAINKFDIKDPVAAATTGALSFSPTYNNGSSGVGATLTGSVGVLIIDGYTPVLNDRLLIKNQASSFQNGIYSVTTVGTVSVGYVLTRTSDFNSSATILYGDTVGVLNGTANANQQFTMNNNNPITVGTTAITFAQTSGGSQLTAGTGITITGNSVALTVPVTVALGGTNATSASGTALDNITGFSSTGFLTRTGAGAYSFQSTTNGITLGNIAQIGANTMLGNWTGSQANISANAMPSCPDSAGNHLNYVNGTGITCGTSQGVNVTSFSGDGTILNNSSSTGAVTATLANANAGTVLGNNTSSAAAPSYTSAPVLGKNATTAGTLGLANGSASGATVTIQNLGATVAYNFNVPTTPGSTNQPLISKGGGSTSMAWGSLSGNTSTFGTTSGTLTNGHCVSIDANGNFVDAGGACTVGGGGGTVNTGTANQLAYYATSTNAVSGNANATISNGAFTLGQSASVQGSLILSGSGSGSWTLAVGSAASGQIKFPSGTTDFTSTGGTSQVVKQISSGAAFTVGQLQCSDLSNAVNSCSTDATNASNITSGTLPDAQDTNVAQFTEAEFIMQNLGGL
jgi:hypothetical protein